MKTNDYYVYEHIRLDNNTCFYVWKGHGNRANWKSRNKHHDRIVQKHGIRVNIIQKNLSEDEAYELERKIIHYYVYNLDYAIDIIGFNKKKYERGHLTNHTFCGDGSYGMVHSDQWKKRHSSDMSGIKNPMFGVNVWDQYTKERAKEIKRKISKASSGENNPMFGVSPQNRMDAETFEIWHQKIVNRGKSLTGANNPNYQNKTLHNKVKDNPELRLLYYSRKGSQNGRSRQIRMFDKDHKIINDFDYIGSCCEYLLLNNITSAKIDTIRSGIAKSIKENKKYKNYYFEYI